jgi:collagen type VII alpha
VAGAAGLRGSAFGSVLAGAGGAGLDGGIGSTFAGGVANFEGSCFGASFAGVETAGFEAGGFGSTFAGPGGGWFEGSGFDTSFAGVETAGFEIGIFGPAFTGSGITGFVGWGFSPVPSPLDAGAAGGLCPVSRGTRFTGAAGEVGCSFARAGGAFSVETAGICAAPEGGGFDGGCEPGAPFAAPVPGPTGSTGPTGCEGAPGVTSTGRGRTTGLKRGIFGRSLGSDGTRPAGRIAGRPDPSTTRRSGPRSIGFPRKARTVPAGAPIRWTSTARSGGMQCLPICGEARRSRGT